MATAPSPRFFTSADALRAWLEKNHRGRDELWIGFFKPRSGKKGITYKEALDEALAFGWIDAVRKGIDDARWTIRFTPRKASSNWSAVNVKRLGELIALGRMHAAGLAAFEKRCAKKTGVYSYEQRKQIELPAAYERALKANARAAHFFSEQPPSYRHVAKYWVMSAKKEETRERRLAQLIESSAKGERLKQFISPARKKK